MGKELIIRLRYGQAMVRVQMKKGISTLRMKRKIIKIMMRITSITGKETTMMMERVTMVSQTCERAVRCLS